MAEPTPLLLLPGLLCDAALWRHQLANLAGQAAMQVADFTQDDTMAAMAARALAGAPPRFALAGLSMGGYVAFEILRQAPGRVTRLALFDTSAAPDEPARQRLRRGAIASVARGQFLGVSHRMLPQLVHADHVDGPVGREVQAMAERVGREAFLRQQAAILARPDSRPQLPGLHMPTLVGVGRQDRMTPLPQVQAMQQAIPGAHLYVFETCGHLPPLECPEETSRLLAHWLDW